MKFLLLFMFVAVALADEESETETTQERAARNLARVFRIDPKDGVHCANKSEVTMVDLRNVEEVIMTDTEPTDMNSVKRGCCAMVCSAQKKGVMVGGVVQEEELMKFLQETGIPEDLERQARNVVHACKEQETETSDECIAGYKFMKCTYKRSRTIGEHGNAKMRGLSWS
ncbi:uncharacterized protein LOC143210199 [Lasioglossum baleicum]|uniref:uncharacterized protein LOC143210199 n=1 Tax=Lasioglossum baleicum TaxID=434251 RepID=UPI003FCED111